jgi:hypothetical protein
MTHITFVVSRDHLEIMPELMPESSVSNVQIIVDRRQQERRQDCVVIDFPERRHFERRSKPNDRNLELLGVSVVISPGPTSS